MESCTKISKISIAFVIQKPRLSGAVFQHSKKRRHSNLPWSSKFLAQGRAYPLIHPKPPSPHSYLPASVCLPTLTLEPHSGFQEHALPKLKPFHSQAKATVIFQEGEKYITMTVTRCNKLMLKGSTDFYISLYSFILCCILFIQQIWQWRGKELHQGFQWHFHTLSPVW